jgi:hypothetical protein
LHDAVEEIFPVIGGWPHNHDRSFRSYLVKTIFICSSICVNGASVNKTLKLIIIHHCRSQTSTSMVVIEIIIIEI